MDLMMEQSFLQNHYDLKPVDKGYEFVTEKGVPYLVTFVEYTLFDISPDLKTYSFNIERLSEQNAKLGQQDDKVRNTVLYVIYRFFLLNQDALITVCDSTDGRQTARKRLFDGWFDRFNDGSLTKTDGTFTIEGHVNFASLIYCSVNKYSADLLREFKLLEDANFYN